MRTLTWVGADKAVPWTKPVDLIFDPSNPKAALGEISDEGFHAIFLDGHTETLPKFISADEFKAFVTPAGGEVIQRLQDLDGFTEPDDSGVAEPEVLESKTVPGEVDDAAESSESSEDRLFGDSP